jgi:ribosomal protein S18 acetylase RimI-like enzyme
MVRRLMTAYSIRPVSAADEPFLWQMLYYAAHMHEERGKTVADVMANPTLALYVTAWGRPGDLGFIAETTPSRRPLGAAWLRLYAGESKTYSPTDDETPELAVALLPDYTGQGIGTALLDELLTAARRQFTTIALSVRAGNPAFRLYQRLGFRVIGELTNRVGGISYDMRWNCKSCEKTQLTK